MVKAKAPTIEEIRKQRLEENKKRMEELNLTKLALAVHQLSAKPSPVKPRTPRIDLSLVEKRRSSRVANMPAPVYTDIYADVFKGARRYSGRRRDLSNRVYASDKARENAIDRAEKLESKLDRGFPSFVKPMTQSHVTGGFWLGLPTHFCNKYLPKRDETVTLIDENDTEWDTVYLAQKRGLSGGWRAFSLDHDLVDGDALVFELVKRTSFKVYILKVNN